MKSKKFKDPGTIASTFTYDPVQPTYWTEYLSWWLVKMASIMALEDWTVFQHEQDEFDILVAGLVTWQASLVTWFDDAVAARDLGNPIPATPTLPTLPTDARTAGLLETILLKIFIPMALTEIRKKFDSTTDSGEISDILKQAFLSPNNSDSILHKAFVLASPQSIGVSANGISNILNVINNQLALFRKLFEVTPDSGEPILKTALLSDAGEALIEALAAVGLNIQLQPQGIFVTYSDQE